MGVHNLQSPTPILDLGMTQCTEGLHSKDLQPAASNLGSWYALMGMGINSLRATIFSYQFQISTRVQLLD